MEIENFFSKFRKRIKFNYSKKSFIFDINQDLFSSAKLDKGTFQLIDSLRKNKKIIYKDILDLGCGYGPIGIILKKLHPNSLIDCTDRDALALEFTRQNAILNNCKIKAYPSLGFEKVNKKFDLICCNYPAKAGEKVLKNFVYNSSIYLKEKGVFTIVIVKELLGDFEKILTEDIEIIHKQKSSSHFVFHLMFKKKLGTNEDPYLKKQINYYLGNKNYILKTAKNIPEFDTPSFITKAITKNLKELKSAREVSIINPFQGHLAIAVSHYLNPKKTNIVSRDLLSLRYSEINLIENGFTNFNKVHRPIIHKESGDLLVWRLGENLEILQLRKQLKQVQNNFSKIILGAKKQKLKRFIKFLKLDPISKKEEKNAMSILINAQTKKL